jgi:tetratricopeptide repeat protein
MVLGMQPLFTPTKPIDRTALPGMLATLCSYESLFGPYHPQTLCLMTQVANAYSQAGEFDCARPLLERAVRDVGRYLGRDHDLRLRAIVTLRDLFIAQRDYERAGVVQNELLECQTQRLGAYHPETLATRDQLGMILLEQVSCDSNRVR